MSIQKIYKLFIAEKPSLGLAIAESLGIEKKCKGYIECKNKQVVTWAYGHVYGLSNPGDYDKSLQYWSLNDLPIIPEKFTLQVSQRKGVPEQVKIINRLIKKADNLVNAGDPDREGQILIDEILLEAGVLNKVPTERICAAAIDSESIKTALNDMKPNSQFVGLRNSALARSHADWLIGMNMTRATTLLAKKKGFNEKHSLSIGRVQTATLNLIAQRDKSINAFTAIDHFSIKINVNHAKGQFNAFLDLSEMETGLNPEGLLIDYAVASNHAESIKNSKGVVTSYSRTLKNQPSPLPFSLSSLKKAASRLGIKAKDVLTIAQSLYEKKVTSYPRADCEYLPLEQFNQAGSILKRLEDQGIKGTQLANIERKGRCWNTEKVQAAAHNAIVPTGVKAINLSVDETKLFHLICTRYIQQFCNDYEYYSEKAVLFINGKKWNAEGQTIKSLGWRELEKETEQGDKKTFSSLPLMNANEPIECVGSELQKKKTKPLARFTDTSIEDAMVHIDKYIDDPKSKLKLKETSGLGTVATRSNVIQTLFDRNYIKADGKKITITELGKQLIEVTPKSLCEPSITAEWEDFLDAIANNEKSYQDFILLQKEMLPNFITEITKNIESLEVGAFSFKSKSSKKSIKSKHSCQVCQCELKQLTSKKNKAFKFWVCTQEFSHPAFFDNKGELGTQMRSK